MRQTGRVIRLLLAAFALSSMMAAPAAATAPPPVEAYAHPPLAADLSLSPDGTHVAYVAPAGGKPVLVIRRLLMAEGDRPVVIPVGDFRILWLAWANSNTLIFELLGTESVMVSGPDRKIPVRYSRLIAAERDGSNVREIYRPKFEPGYYKTTSGQILQFIDDEHVMIAVPDRARQVVGKLNIYTGRLEHQDRDNRQDLIYLPDPSGQLRLARSFSDRTGKLTYWYRTSLNEDFKPLVEFDPLAEDGMDVLGFGPDDQLYVVSWHESDRAAVYTFDIATGTLGGKVLGDDMYDVDAPILQKGRVVGLTYMRDMPVRVFFDPALQQLQETLDRAIPDSTELIIERTRDGRFTLVASHAPNLPTIYRLFDRDTRQFMPFADTFPEIPDEALATRQAVTYKARDGLTIPGYLTLPPGKEARNLPFVVMPHGGPIARDDQKFDILSQFLAGRGYAVLQPNFRGSSGYGAAFMKAGLRQWGRAMQTDVVDGVRWAIETGVADPDRICIVGWSYGGYSALMGAVQNSDLFKCAIATAPVTNLDRLWKELRWSGLATQFNRSLFFGEKNDALREVSPYHQAKRIGIPVMLIHGDLDAQAFIQHSRDMVDALLNARIPHEYIEIDGMDHSPRTTEEMARVLSAWERFLKQHIGN